MALDVQPTLAAQFLREIMVTMIRRNDAGLSAYQLAVFLSCYLSDRDLTVRDLAMDMGTTKANISRAFDKLVERGLVSRVADPHDGRVIYIGQTAAGAKLLAEFGDIGQMFMKQSAARAA